MSTGERRAGKRCTFRGTNEHESRRGFDISRDSTRKVHHAKYAPFEVEAFDTLPSHRQDDTASWLLWNLLQEPRAEWIDLKGAASNQLWIIKRRMNHQNAPKSQP